MKAPRPLGRLRPLALRSGRRDGPRARGLPLVWRAQAQRARTSLNLFRGAWTTLAQTFPIRVSLFRQPAPAAAATVRTERETVHRESLRLLSPPTPPGQRLLILVSRLSERIRELSRRGPGATPRASPGGRIDAAPRAANAKPRMEIYAADRVRERRIERAGLFHPRKDEGGIGLSPMAILPRKAEARLLPGTRPSLGLVPPLRHPQSRRAATAATPVPAGSAPRRAPRAVPALRFWGEGRGMAAGTVVEPSRRPAHRRQAPTAHRAPVELVWTRASLIEDGHGDTATAAVAPPVASGAAPQTWHSRQPTSAAASGAAAQAAMPDMNRLVDEVVRRLDRIARDERMRRGI